MRISKWLKIVGFLAAIAVVNQICSFLIEPAGGASARMWGGYYEQEELDTIFVGSSVCQMTFIPEVFDERLGVKSYNMGTPSQAMPQTMQAIKAAVEEHDIKRIVYAMGFSSLKYTPIDEAEITFESARVRKKGGIKGFLETISYMYGEDVIAKEKSVNFMFPWLYNYEELSKDAIIKNIAEKSRKLEQYFLTGEYDETDELLKGFRNDDMGTYQVEKRWEENSYRFYGANFDIGMLEEFKRMLAFCEERGIELIVVNVPHPSYDVVACYESYLDNTELVKKYCDKYGADYYDFSLVKPELFVLEDTHFGDYEHLNRAGAEVFCQELCNFWVRRANGEDMSRYFYSVEEFLEHHSEELQEWEKGKVR